ncbi:hypothetical protein [Lacihabitans sp. CCS-44]|uniref:hypothetical protein n=1 Tax=Lacihabitans sp. CCS-44 TaxID=2487331 RepID=UPI0020CC8261|nr:hypothetical protein [Lacihabitans sp. CCS-44]
MPIIFSIRGCESLAFDANTGVIGDTIGGITAPFINFLGAILVYLALNEQIKANELIQNQFYAQEKSKNEELLFEKTYHILNLLITSLIEFSFKNPFSINGETGSRAIANFLEFSYSSNSDYKSYRKEKKAKFKEREFINILTDINQLLSFFLDHPDLSKSYIKIFYFRFTKIPILIPPDEIFNSEIEEYIEMSNEIYDLHLNFRKLYNLVMSEKGIKQIDFQYLDVLKLLLKA